MSSASQRIPEDLHRFLAANEGRQFAFDRKVHSHMEVDSFDFYAPKELTISILTVDTDEYHLNYEEPGDDPKLQFDIEGISLIRTCNSYDPEGILAYFPALKEYGTWDCDHYIINMFSQITWSEIESRLADYINAQWYPSLVNQYLLRPWADERCSQIVPRRRE